MAADFPQTTDQIRGFPTDQIRWFSADTVDPSTDHGFPRIIFEYRGFLVGAVVAELDLGVVLKTFSSSVIKNLFSKSTILRSLSNKHL